MKTPETPDSVCARFADRGVSLRVVSRTEPRESAEDPSETFIILEGSADSLRFLGELLIAQSEFSRDCHFSIHPTGPGQAFFEASSEAGISIHRLPCDDDPIK